MQNYLLAILQAFNFGPNFIKWIQILYSEPKCCAINNGHYSQFFTLSRGIRQGCPISALLFLLVVEVMAIHIRNNSSIKGIKYSDSEQMVISQFADDTTLFLSDTESLTTCLTFIEKFGDSSGLKLNKEKSEAFWIGSNTGSNAKPLKLKWTDCIKCLDIWSGPNVEGIIEMNYKEKLQNIKTSLNIWAQQNFSLQG